MGRLPTFRSIHGGLVQRARVASRRSRRRRIQRQRALPSHQRRLRRRLEPRRRLGPPLLVRGAVLLPNPIIVSFPLRSFVRLPVSRVRRATINAKELLMKELDALISGGATNYIAGVRASFPCAAVMNDPCSFSITHSPPFPVVPEDVRSPSGVL